MACHSRDVESKQGGSPVNVPSLTLPRNYKTQNYLFCVMVAGSPVAGLCAWHNWLLYPETRNRRAGNYNTEQVVFSCSSEPLPVLLWVEPVADLYEEDVVGRRPEQLA